MSDVTYLPSILRAMAKNYAGGHRWDHLDSEAVEKSADRIEALEAELAKLRAGGEPVAFEVKSPNTGKVKLYRGSKAHLMTGFALAGYVVSPLSYVTPQPSAVPDGAWKQAVDEICQEGLGKVIRHIITERAKQIADAAAPTVQGDEITDSERLDFMLSGHRKIVVERLPHDNKAIYVEEGFMGDIRYPEVLYSGTWECGSPEDLEIKREAIGEAIAAARKGEGA